MMIRIISGDEVDLQSFALLSWFTPFFTRFVLFRSGADLESRHTKYTMIHGLTSNVILTATCFATNVIFFSASTFHTMHFTIRNVLWSFFAILN